MNDSSRGFLALLLRSPDIGNGWRQVSKVLWRAVMEFQHQELLELDEQNLRVRLSTDGAVVVKYM